MPPLVPQPHGGAIYRGGVPGNKSGGGGGPPIKHGRYAKIKRKELADLIREMEADPDPYNVLPELATVRALTKDWIDRYTETVDALLAWNVAEYDDASELKSKPRPARIPQIEDALPLLSEISKIVKRIEDSRSANAVSRPDLLRVMGEMGRVVAHHCEVAVAQAIRDDWLKIKL